MNNTVYTLAVHDSGSGPEFYAGGDFTTADGVAANRVAKWNGTSWVALGSGMNLLVYALAVHDAGSGPELYAGGAFTTAGGVAASRVARWNGTSWIALGSGMNERVSALSSHDDGSGTHLYAGGVFTTAGGAAAARVARWDGASWSALDGGMNGFVVGTLLSANAGTGLALFAGGSFGAASNSGDSYVARWGCLDTAPPVLTCPPSVDILDRFPGGIGEVVFFSVTAVDDADPAPEIECVPPSGSLFAPGTTFVTCTATDASGNEATCQFPVTVQPKARRR